MFSTRSSTIPATLASCLLPLAYSILIDIEKKDKESLLLDVKFQGWLASNNKSYDNLQDLKLR